MSVGEPPPPPLPWTSLPLFPPFACGPGLWPSTGPLLRPDGTLNRPPKVCDLSSKLATVAKKTVKGGELKVHPAKPHLVALATNVGLALLSFPSTGAPPAVPLKVCPRDSPSTCLLGPIPCPGASLPLAPSWPPPPSPSCPVLLSEAQRLCCRATGSPWTRALAPEP